MGRVSESPDFRMDCWRSRVLNDEEVVIVANTNPTQAQALDVIVDLLLSSGSDPFSVLYSNQANPLVPQAVRVVQQGAAAVNEIDGSIGHGPLHVVRVSLRPMEVQILRRAAQ